MMDESLISFFVVVTIVFGFCCLEWKLIFCTTFFNVNFKCLRYRLANSWTRLFLYQSIFFHYLVWLCLFFRKIAESKRKKIVYSKRFILQLANLRFKNLIQNIYSMQIVVHKNISISSTSTSTITIPSQCMVIKE